MSTSSPAEWPYTADQVNATSIWQIDIFTDPKSLEAEWLHLSLEGHAGPFQTLGWLSAWYSAATRFGLAEPLILTGSRRADGRPDVIMPLCLHKAYGCIIISSPDFGVSDLYEPIMSKGLLGDGDALQAFFKEARKQLPFHDLIFISKLEASTGGSTPALAPARFLAKLPYSAWSLELDNPGVPNADKLVKPKMRRTVRQKINQLRKIAAREIVFCDDLNGTDALDIVWTMRADRFTAVNRSDGLKQAAWRHLYEEVCKGRHADLKPFSAMMTCDREPIGAQLGILHKNHFVGTLLSFKMGPYQRYSPGLQVVFESVRQLVQNGVSRFDLSVGDQPYKSQLGCKPRPLYEMLVPGSLKGAAAWAVWRSKHDLRSYPRLFNTLKGLHRALTWRH